jgi:hypothetical protein
MRLSRIATLSSRPPPCANFFCPRRPYYIDAPAYRRTSAGIRVMHLLCHALNSIGEEAYVYPTETNPTLNTPLVTPEISARHKAAGREPIVVYPEVVPGNPRKAASVVRYVLNRAGLLGVTASMRTPSSSSASASTRCRKAPTRRTSCSCRPSTPPSSTTWQPLRYPTQRALLYPGRHQAALAQYPSWRPKRP